MCSDLKRLRLRLFIISWFEKLLKHFACLRELIEVVEGGVGSGVGRCGRLRGCFLVLSTVVTCNHPLREAWAGHVDWRWGEETVCAGQCGLTRAVAPGWSFVLGYGQAAYHSCHFGPLSLPVRRQRFTIRYRIGNLQQRNYYIYQQYVSC